MRQHNSTIVRRYDLKKAISIATAALAAASVRALPALGHDHGHGQRRSYSAGEPGDPTKPSRTIEIEMSEMDYKPFKIEVKLGEQKRPRIEGTGTAARTTVGGRRYPKWNARCCAGGRI